MKPTKTEQLDLSMRSSTGFSLIELMVVVTILGGLAAIGLPRFRTFLARSRQAEAKTLLSQIHTLQTSYQLHNDHYAHWAKANLVGYGGAGTHKCSIANETDGKTSTHPTAKDLGFKFDGCEEARYGYWITREINNGREYYIAVAYAPSDTQARIFPTCDGTKVGNTATARDVAKIKYDAAGTTESEIGVVNGGDWQAITDSKDFIHDDILTPCE